MNRKYIDLSIKFPLIGKILYFLKKSKIILEGHPFLTLANFTAIILASIPFLDYMINFDPKQKVYGLLFFVPALAVYLVSLFSYLLFKKFPNFSRILSFCLNITLIVVVQIIISSIIWYHYSEIRMESIYNKLENYPLALEAYPAEQVAHFPQKIPAEASNIVFFAKTYTIFGNQFLYLKFDIDKKYIENELKKHSFLKTWEYDSSQKYYYNGINFSDFTFYDVGDSTQGKQLATRLPYYYGIGVNKKQSQILYYYVTID